MTKKRSKKVTALIIALVLITSCFVGGTIARYVTSTSSEDSARVAVWGINADGVEMNLFASEYDVNGNKVAKSWNGDKIIAPGTSMASNFSIVNLDDTLAPEVMYEIKIDVDDTEIDQRILDNPSIQWKLDDNAFGTWEETKAAILALSGDASGVKTYAPNTVAADFANGETHTIAWQWIMDNNNDPMDTQMGNEATAGDITAKISVRVTARQVNTESATGSTPIVHNGTIPANATYYKGVTEKTVGAYTTATETLTEGETFPTTETNDIYVYDNLEYRYNMEYDYLSEEWVENTSLNGWSARSTDPYVTEYEIIGNINNINLVSLKGAFSATALTTPPVIPETVTSLESTFQAAIKLTTPPTIPNNVVNMKNAFDNAIRLTTAPDIPANVDNLWCTFKGCTALTGTIKIDANPSEYFSALLNTNITEVTGATTLKAEILATTNN